MDFLSLTPALLTELLQLVEEKQSLDQKIAQIDQKMQRLLNGKGAVSPALSASRPSKRASRTKMKRGQLRPQVVEILKSAGQVGVTVQDIAKTLGVDSIKIHAWFATTGKKTREVSRIAKGRYAFNSGASVPAEPGQSQP